MRPDLINFDSKRIAKTFTATYRSVLNLFIASSTESIIQQINTRHQAKGKITEWELRWKQLRLDIDNDGLEEIIMFNGYCTRMRIFHPNFTHPIDVYLYEPTHLRPIVTLKKNGSQGFQMLVQAGAYSTLFTLEKIHYTSSDTFFMLPFIL